MTVDSYQGLEKKIVILSTVRQNDTSRKGIFKNKKSVCTAMSRASDILIIVCGEMLRKGQNIPQFWKKFHLYWPPLQQFFFIFF